MSKKLASSWMLLLLLLFAQNINAQNSSGSSGSGNSLAPTLIANSSNAWLHLRFANQSSKLVRLEEARNQRPGYAIEVSPPPSTFQYLPVRSVAVANGSSQLRSTRTAVNFDDSQDSSAELELSNNLLVSNACERDFMLVEVKSSRPFYGLIHTLDHRRKLICTTQGDGGTHYKLTISHALNPHDPQHCGVARLTSNTNNNILSVILAIRSNRNIELSEDKFFALNCTNRCRRPDCASGQLAIGRLVGELQAKNSNGWRALERETGDLSANPNQLINTNDQCSLWRPPWLVAALGCLSIVLIGMLISNCIICAALRASERRTVELEAATVAKSSSRRKVRKPEISYENEPPVELEYESYSSARPARSHQQNNGKATTRVVKSYRS